MNLTFLVEIFTFLKRFWSIFEGSWQKKLQKAILSKSKPQIKVSKIFSVTVVSFSAWFHVLMLLNLFNFYFIFEAIIKPLGTKYYKKWGHDPSVTVADAHQWPVLCDATVSSTECLATMIEKWDRPYTAKQFHFSDNMYSQIQAKCHRNSLAGCVFENWNDENNFRCQCLHMMWSTPVFSLKTWNDGFWKLEEVSRILDGDESGKCSKAFSSVRLPYKM